MIDNAEPPDASPYSIKTACSVAPTILSRVERPVKPGPFWLTASDSSQPFLMASQKGRSIGN
jgi:hypothetical protein